MKLIENCEIKATVKSRANVKKWYTPIDIQHANERKKFDISIPIIIIVF